MEKHHFMNQDLKGHTAECRLDITCLPKKWTSREWCFWGCALFSKPKKTNSEHIYTIQPKLRGQQLPLLLFEHFFLKSHLSLQIFEFLGLLLFRMKMRKLLSMETNQSLSFWKLQVGQWFCDQRWKNSLILHPLRRQVPHWQPQGCGLCQASEIRHSDYPPSVNLFETRHTVQRGVTSVPLCPTEEEGIFVRYIFASSSIRDVYLFINLFYENCTSYTVQYLLIIYCPDLGSTTWWKVQLQNGALPFPV